MISKGASTPPRLKTVILPAESRHILLTLLPLDDTRNTRCETLAFYNMASNLIVRGFLYQDISSVFIHS